MEITQIIILIVGIVILAVIISVLIFVVFKRTHTSPTPWGIKVVNKGLPTEMLAFTYDFAEEGERKESYLIAGIRKDGTMVHTSPHISKQGAPIFNHMSKKLTGDFVSPGSQDLAYEPLPIVRNFANVVTLAQPRLYTSGIGVQQANAKIIADNMANADRRVAALRDSDDQDAINNAKLAKNNPVTPRFTDWVLWYKNGPYSFYFWDGMTTDESGNITMKNSNIMIGYLANKGGLQRIIGGIRIPDKDNVKPTVTSTGGGYFFNVNFNDIPTIPSTTVTPNTKSSTLVQLGNWGISNSSIIDPTKSDEGNTPILAFTYSGKLLCGLKYADSCRNMREGESCNTGGGWFTTESKESQTVRDNADLVLNPEPSVITVVDCIAV
jgi:hypothetical protein